jgi:hypothetical protein
MIQEGWRRKRPGAVLADGRVVWPTRDTAAAAADWDGWTAGPGYSAELADCETQNSLPSGSVSVIQVWEPC